MDFGLTEERAAIVAMARDFAAALIVVADSAKQASADAERMTNIAAEAMWEGAL